MFPGRVRRWLYRRRHASRLARLLNAAQARLAAVGVGPKWLVMVQVTGRRTGKTISFPAVVADYGNDRYLVSMLGADTNWVRNVRAAGGTPCCVTAAGNRSGSRMLTSTAALRSCAATSSAPGARAHFPVGYRALVEAFEPIAAQYPVFRITPADKPAR